MIDSRTKLDIIHDDNGTFIDHSVNAVDFSRDTFSLTLDAVQDYLYIGFRKPIGATYAEVTTPNENSGSFEFEYYNGSTWESLSVRDETTCLRRSGFITWDKPSDWSPTAINSITKYWVRARPSTTTSAIVVRGVNLIFADDAALNGEFAGIINSAFYQSGESSHILQHIAARNQIIDQLRRLGYIKNNATTGSEMINQWELLDIYEVRQAAVCQALSNIFFNMSDSPDDNWFNKHLHYSKKAEDILRGLAISIDTDDDGKKDTEEKLQKIKVTRFQY